MAPSNRKQADLGVKPLVLSLGLCIALLLLFYESPRNPVYMSFPIFADLGLLSLAYSAFLTVRSLLALLFVFFIPGFFVWNLLYLRDGNSEFYSGERILAIIAFSVVITIVCMVYLNIAKADITVVNTLTLSATLTSVLAFFDYLAQRKSNPSQSLRKPISQPLEGASMQLLSALAVTVVVVSAMIASSISAPPKEEFLEIYWTQEKVTSFRPVAVSPSMCGISNCSASGSFNLADISLAGRTYRIAMIDWWWPKSFMHFCIDSDYDGVYCEDGEGPFGAGDTVIVGGHGYTNTQLYTTGERIAFASVPTIVTEKQENFSVEYAMKSYYKERKIVNITYTLNGEEKGSWSLPLDSGEEITRSLFIELGRPGDYQVRLSTPPGEFGRDNYIDFWVRVV
jgi:hypothetical protein